MPRPPSRFEAMSQLLPVAKVEVKRAFAEIKAVLSNPESSVVEVKSALREPLVFLHLIRHTGDPAATVESHPTYLPAIRAYVLSTLYGPHLEYVMRSVPVDWLPALTAQESAALFDAYFVPLQTFPENDSELVWCKQRAATESLLALTGILTDVAKEHCVANSLSDDPHREVHSVVLRRILYLLPGLLKGYGPLDFWKACRGHNAENFDDPTWELVVNVLGSLPERAARVWGVETAESLTSTPHFRNLVDKIISDLQQASNEKLLNICTFESDFSKLFTKFSRQGHSRKSTKLMMHLSERKRMRNNDVQKKFKDYLAEGMYRFVLEVAISLFTPGTKPQCSVRKMNLLKAIMESVADAEVLRILDAMLKQIGSKCRTPLKGASSLDIAAGSFLLSIFLGPCLRLDESLTSSNAHVLLPVDDSTLRSRFLLQTALDQKGYDEVIIRVIIGYLSGRPDNIIVCLLNGQTTSVSAWDLKENNRPLVDFGPLVKAFENILQLWANKDMLRHTGVEQQQNITRSLLLCLANFPTQPLRCGNEVQPDDFQVTLQNATRRAGFVDGVGNYLEWTEPRTRTCGLVAAEILSQRLHTLPKTEDGNGAPNSLDFGLDSNNNLVRQLREISKLDDWRIAFHGNFNEAVRDLGNYFEVLRRGGSETEQMISEDSGPESNNTNAIVSTLDDDAELDPDEVIVDLATMNLTDIGFEEDSDTESLEAYPMEFESELEELDPNLTTKKLVPPKYLRECLAGLRATEDPDRTEGSLAVAALLIDEADSRDLYEVATDIATVLLNLQDTYELKDFSKNQKNAMVELLCRCPESIARFTAEQVYARNYNVSQRFLMLESLAIAARKLAGWDVDDNKQASSTSTFAPHTSARSLSRAGSVDAMAVDVHLALQNKDNSTSGKTRRFSQKSEVNRKMAQPRRNEYSQHAESFIYPLMRGLFACPSQGGGGGGAMPSWLSGNRGIEPIMLEKTMVTIALLLYCAVNIPKFPSLCREFWDLAYGLRYAYPHTSVPPSVTKAFLFGLTVVIRGLPLSLIIRDFARDIVEIQSWAQDLFETTEDEGLKGQAGSFLLGVLEIIQAFQHETMGQFLTM